MVSDGGGHGKDTYPFLPGSEAREVLELLAGRWTIAVLGILDDGPARFTTLRTKTGMSPQVLTRTLRRLEDAGLLDRQVFAEVPPRAEYSLTDLGSTLCPLVHQFRDWAVEHGSEVVRAQTASRFKRPR